MRQAREFEDISSDIPVLIVTMKRFAQICGEATMHIQCHASTSTSHTEGANARVVKPAHFSLYGSGF